LFNDLHNVVLVKVIGDAFGYRPKSCLDRQQWNGEALTALYTGIGRPGKLPRQRQKTEGSVNEGEKGCSQGSV